MKALRLASHAKINLYLKLVGTRSDGYTNIVTVFQSVGLADEVTLTMAEGITITCTQPLVPCDQRNIAYKAAHLLQTHTGSRQGVRIAIHKNIPVAAGLAGGSGNGAAVLVGLNQLWHLGLSQAELTELGAQLGSDVPFCMQGGTALGYGRGEQLAALKSPPPLALLLVKPRDLQISTAWAYKSFRTQTLAEAAAPDLSGLLSYLADPLSQPLGTLLYNDLERVVLPAHPRLERLKVLLNEAGATAVLMSGSGSTVFALAEDQGHAQHLARAIDPQVYSVFVTHTHDRGLTLNDV